MDGDQAGGRKRSVDNRIGSRSKLAKNHHRKVEPWRPGWARELHVWPYLVRIEFLVTVIVTVILFVWSITLNAPRRACESKSDYESLEGPLVLPWSSGNVGLLRSVDRRRGDAEHYYGRLNGFPLC